MGGQLEFIITSYTVNVALLTKQQCDGTFVRFKPRSFCYCCNAVNIDLAEIKNAATNEIGIKYYLEQGVDEK
jgi:hypothetical protein